MQNSLTSCACCSLKAISPSATLITNSVNTDITERMCYNTVFCLTVHSCCKSPIINTMFDLICFDVCFSYFIHHIYPNYRIPKRLSILDLNCGQVHLISYWLTRHLIQACYCLLRLVCPNIHVHANKRKPVPLWQCRYKHISAVQIYHFLRIYI